MRNIKNIHQAVAAPIDRLATYRAMPTRSIDYLDPFLFLNHHGPQAYPPHNEGLPFGPHPHRGFETLTYIFKGDIMHWDSNGHKSVIEEGGIQWMTAGRGLIHSEISSEKFKEQGGEVEIIQLWLNLPARLKMTQPNYVGLAKEQLPVVAHGEASVTLISGNWGDAKGPVHSLTGLTMSSIAIGAGKGASIEHIPASHTVLFYVVRGALRVNGQQARKHELVEFDYNHSKIAIEATEDCLLIFGHGEPFREKVVAQGPFVMNSEEEIMMAYRDFRMGKMGVWTN